MVRTPCCDKNGLRKGRWTPEEDSKLIAYVTRYGHWNWSLLPKFAGLARCGKSCRLRWMNYLRPNIKRGNYTQEEEETITKLHEKLGNRHDKRLRMLDLHFSTTWSTIAAHLPGRSDNDIKNYWHRNLKKSIQQKSPTTIEKAHEVSQSKDYSPVESNHERDSGASTSHTQDSCPFPPRQTALPSDLSPITTETAGAGGHLVLEDCFAFYGETYAEPMTAEFWTEPYVADMSYFPGELLASLVTEPGCLSPENECNTQLWS